MKHYLFIWIVILALSGTQAAFAESWSQINGSAPPAVSGHTLVSIDNMVYLFGGEDSTAEAKNRTANTRGDTLNDLWAFNKGNNTWSKKSTSNSPSARKNHTAVSYEGKMYVHGGVTSSDTTLDMWEYDPGTNKWTELQSSSTQKPKLHQRAAVVGDKIIVTGGLDEESGKATGETWAYYLQYKTWNRQADCPSPRYGHATFVHDSKVYVTAGRNDEEFLDDMWSYDVAEAKWTKITPRGKPTALKSVAFDANNDVFIMAGGIYQTQLDGFEYNILSKETWEYDIQGNEWTQKKDGPEFVFGSGAILNPSTRSSSSYQALFFGGLRNSVEINETWLYDSSSTSSCSSTDNDLNVNIACVNYNSSQYQANLSLVTHSVNPQTLLWKLDSATSITHTGSDSDNCASLDSELTLQFNCVLVDNNPYQAELNAYTHPTDPSGFFWTLGSATEKQ